MINNSSRPEEMLKFACKRNTTNLFKHFLEIIERLNLEHVENMNKLKHGLPKEYAPYVELADYFTESKLNALRKEILSKGNDTYRSLEEIINMLEISIKK
jgi:hypothetical protein